MMRLAKEGFARRNFILPGLIVQNMTKVIVRSSIVSVFEKIRFRDVASALSSQDVRFLSSGLYELLHGEEQVGFEMIRDVLSSRQSAKWTLMTVCQTYYHPHRDVFIKPTTVKAVIEFFELRHLQDKPAPSWSFYEAYRAAFLEMKSKVDPSLGLTNPAFSGFLFLSVHQPLIKGRMISKKITPET